MDDVYLTTTEVLEYLQVNLRTVYRLLKAGSLPAVRVGRQWRFRRADLDAWLEGQRSTARRAGAAPRPAAPAAVAAPAAKTAAPAPRRVLVADDEESIRETLSRTLVLAEYSVETVADGPSAVECLRAEAFDLLIADLSMPGLDGLAVVREARRLHPRIAVVIITGYPTEASAIEAINLGVSGYLTKPFRLAKVLAVVAHALGDEE